MTLIVFALAAAMTYLDPGADDANTFDRGAPHTLHFRHIADVEEGSTAARQAGPRNHRWRVLFLRMTASYEILRALSLMAFLFYGSACVFAGSMEADFERFGLSHMRVLVGSLELLGALGLLAGYFHAPLVAVASGGLSLLMLFGVATRIRVGDPFVASLPALTLCLVNAFIFAVAVVGRRAAHSGGH